jgi:hypothetical protein
MTTLYTRTFSFKDSLTDQEVLREWQFAMEQVVPAVSAVPGVRSVKFFSGPGALRANLSIMIEMDDAGAYERLLLNPGVRQFLGRLYGAWDLKTAGQSFQREVTSELIRALSSTG